VENTATHVYLILKRCYLINENMKQLIFATSNANKLKEIRLIVDGDYEILGLQDIGHIQEIPEPFNTLEENAVHKVNTIAKLYNINCFAEDTGLMIDALNGEPGVFSARYAGEEKSAEANIAKVLRCNPKEIMVLDTILYFTRKNLAKLLQKYL